MKILALDQSSRITGWAIFEGKTLSSYGKFDASKSHSDIAPRLTFIKRQVAELIEKNQQVDLVCLEEIQLQNSVGNNVSTFKTLAYVQAVIIQYLDEIGMPYVIIPSSVWKSTLSIKGKSRPEQKKAAVEYVVGKYNIKPTQDEVDAICIGTHYIQKNSCAWA